MRSAGCWACASRMRRTRRRPPHDPPTPRLRRTGPPKFRQKRRMGGMTTRAERIAALKAAAKERILILDGSWGVMIQKRGLAEADYRGERFKDAKGELKGNNDVLCLTRPDIIAELHDAYYGAGADISETNTFSATSIAQAEYGLQAAVRDINFEGARIAREVADRW